MKYILILGLILFFTGCSSKEPELIVKKEYVFINACDFILPEFLVYSQKVEIPELKDNSEKELVKVKTFITKLINSDLDHKNKLKTIENLYLEYRKCKEFNSF